MYHSHADLICIDDTDCLKRIFNLICKISEFLALFQDIGFSAIHIFLNEDPKGKVDHHYSIFTIFLFTFITSYYRSQKTKRSFKGTGQDMSFLGGRQIYLYQKFR